MVMERERPLKWLLIALVAAMVLALIGAAAGNNAGLVTLGAVAAAFVAYAVLRW
jgi:hypothetical protein